MKEALQALGDYIAHTVPDRVLDHYVAHDELMVICEASHVVSLLTFLRDDEQCLFSQLMDVTAVDFPNRVARFEVVYNLLSLKKNKRIRVKVNVAEDVSVSSVNGVYPSAGWFEREVWDMYGIFFDGHPDLRRILTDYGFDGHPQRKDFPLTGYVELRYDDDQKRVVYEKVKLNQAYRSFDFESPWEGPGEYLSATPPAPAPTPPSAPASTVAKAS